MTLHSKKKKSFEDKVGRSAVVGSQEDKGGTGEGGGGGGSWRAQPLSQGKPHGQAQLFYDQLRKNTFY